MRGKDGKRRGAVFEKNNEKHLYFADLYVIIHTIGIII